MAFGTRFNAATRAQLSRAANPSAPGGPEAIWHQLYDTQTYVDNTTTRLTFFQTTNVDPTITNMQGASQLPAPQYFTIYDITCDIIQPNTVSAAASVVGAYNDLFLLLLDGRPTWTLSISDKQYGPYSLSSLHATGGPVGGVDAGTAAEIHQWGTNAMSPGWNYNGSIIIPPNVNFSIQVNWSAAQNLVANRLIRLSMFGILSRRVL